MPLPLNPGAFYFAEPGWTADFQYLDGLARLLLVLLNALRINSSSKIRAAFLVEYSSVLS